MASCFFQLIFGGVSLLIVDPNDSNLVMNEALGFSICSNSGEGISALVEDLSSKISTISNDSVSVKVNPLKIIPIEYFEKSIYELRNRFDNIPSRFPASAHATFSYNFNSNSYQKNTNTNTISFAKKAIEIDITTEIIVPAWKYPLTLSVEDANLWSNYSCGLFRHEVEHLNISIRGMAALSNKISALSGSSHWELHSKLESLWNASQFDFDFKQKNFDTITDHGPRL